jgi:cyclopropane fatty-acyl-phospholipid synthase-like methyltransferase
VTFTTGQTPTPATSAPTGAALSTAHADAAGVAAGDRALDVGCGPGVLLAELSRRLGADVPELLDAAPAREGRAMSVGR